MKVLLKLFSTEEQASDGSRIPRYSCEEYLLSEDYKLIIQDKLSLGGITHKDRKLDSQYDGVIGMDDQILVNDNVTHWISKMFFKEGDPFLYAFIEIFDPELFTGKRRENIVNLLGMLKTGVKLPVSVVIQALWSTMNVAEKIIRIKGVDFTNNPAFAGAGTVKTMSSYTSVTPKEESKIFSYIANHPDLNGCKMMTKSFSAEVVVIGDDMPEGTSFKVRKDSLGPTGPCGGPGVTGIRTYSRKDIVQKFGLNSPEALSTKTFSRFITETELRKLASEYREKHPESLVSEVCGAVETALNIEEKNAGDGINLGHLVELAKSIVDKGNEDVIEAVFRENKPKFVQILNSVPVTEPNRDELLKIKLNEFFRVLPRTAHFSTINSVRDRLLMEKYPRYALINRIVKSYKNYFDSAKDRLSDSELNMLKVLFIQDINLIFKRVQENIKQGSTLNSLYALTQFNDELAQQGIKLSRIYRQVLVSESILGFVPEKKYKEWMKELGIFYDIFCNYVLGSPYGNELTILDKL